MQEFKRSAGWENLLSKPGSVNETGVCECVLADLLA
jgi:hypothetical protein